MKNYGFIKGNIEQEDYVFGGSHFQGDVLRPDGDWTSLVPEYEAQSTDAFDTYGCTIFTTDNALETIMKCKFGVTANYSERYQYNLIPVRPPGGSPQAVAENIREFGVVDQALYPMTQTFEEYTQPEPIDPEMVKQGKKWLESYELVHDYIWKRQLPIQAQNSLLKEALKYSPIGISVTAWSLSDEGYYVDNGEPNNHWTLLIKLWEKNGKIYRDVFDTYDHSIKTLDPDHNIEIAKSYYINPAKKKVEKPNSALSNLLAWFKGLYLKYEV
jgi:hypothetical protein